MHAAKRNMLESVVCVALWAKTDVQVTGMEREWGCPWEEERDWELQVHGKSGKSIQTEGEQDDMDYSLMSWGVEM